MELFSEIYSAYYNVTAEILSNGEISKKDIEKLIRKKAFSESILYLMPKLTDTKTGWNLLKKSNNDTYKSILKSSPKMPMSLLEKRWIKSLLIDDRIKLFLDDDTINTLNKRLYFIKPLYKQEYFYYFDRYTYGDNFKDINYIQNFRTIIKAIKNRLILNINSIDILPIKLEYSNMENRFRVYSAYIKNNNIFKVEIINLKDIHSINTTDKTYTGIIDYTQIYDYNKCKIPIILEIYPQRNGVERFMMEFSRYEKHTELDNLTGICTAKIWYNITDEDELILQLLSFGSTLKVISPNDIVNRIKSVIDTQYNILCNK